MDRFQRASKDLLPSSSSEPALAALHKCYGTPSPCVKPHNPSLSATNRTPLRPLPPSFLTPPPFLLPQGTAPVLSTLLCSALLVFFGISAVLSAVSILEVELGLVWKHKRSNRCHHCGKKRRNSRLTD